MDSDRQFQHLNLEVAGDVQVVQIVDRKVNNQQELAGLDEELTALVQPDVRNVLLDLSAVEAGGSVLLSRLITLKQQLQDRGGRLVLCNLQPFIRRVFAITRLKDAFTIADDVDAGLAAF